MPTINVEEVTGGSVTLEYRGVVVTFCLGTNKRPVKTKTVGPFHALQAWEKQDIYAKAVAILRKQKAKEK
jgi:hypothetical protein